MDLGATLYIHNTLSAVDFYRNAFGMTLGYNAKHDDGTYLHAELARGGRTIFAVSENREMDIVQAMLATRQPTMSLGVNLDTDDELRHAFEILAAGGHVLREPGALPWTPLAADVVDKYGVCWYIFVSQHRPEEA